MSMLVKMALMVLAALSVVVRAAPLYRANSVPVEFVHHGNGALYDVMTQVANDCPKITRLYSIGKSVNGLDLRVIEISDNPGVHEPGEPEFKYIGNMHGNEVTGRETLLHLMNYLCTKYGVDSSVTRLVDTTRIHILPTMNPDGYAIASESDSSGLLGRNNANDFDLNRNFPDHFGGQQYPLQPETRAVMQWLKDYPFVLSANFHNGALVANYPYDNSANGLSVLTPTEDDAIFQQLARSYARAHATMSSGDPCPDGTAGFPDGITNGAAWYSVSGGMQDYNYIHTSCYEITVEQGCTKYPPASQLEEIWKANKAAMLAFIEEVHKGVKGFVVDRRGAPISGASVGLVGHSSVVTSAASGDYWRLLPPGTHTVRVSASGYAPQERTVTVDNGPAVQLNFSLFEDGPTVAVFNAPPDDATTASSAAATDVPNATTTIITATTNDVSAQASFTIVSSQPSATQNEELHETTGAPAKTKKSQVVSMVIVAVMAAIILLLLGAIIVFTVIIARHFMKTRHTFKGFSPLPLDEQAEPAGFSYKMVHPPTHLPLVEAPAYNDDPPAELPVSISSDTEDVIYHASGTTSKL